jgi:hypothetical protein
VRYGHSNRNLPSDFDNLFGWQTEIIDRAVPWSSDIPTTATTAEFIADGNCLVAVATKSGVEAKRDTSTPFARRFAFCLHISSLPGWGFFPHLGF